MSFAFIQTDKQKGHWPFLVLPVWHLYKQDYLHMPHSPTPDFNRELSSPWAHDHFFKVMLPRRRENHYIYITRFHGPFILLSLWQGFNFSQGWHDSPACSNYFPSLFGAGFKASPEELPSHEAPCRRYGVLCSPEPANTADQPSSHFSFWPFLPPYKVAALPREGAGSRDTRHGTIFNLLLCVCGFLEPTQHMWRRV